MRFSKVSMAQNYAKLILTCLNSCEESFSLQKQQLEQLDCRHSMSAICPCCLANNMAHSCNLVYHLIL